MTADHAEQDFFANQRLESVRTKLAKIEENSEAPASGRLNLVQPTPTNTFSNELNSNSYYI